MIKALYAQELNKELLKDYKKADKFMLIVIFIHWVLVSTLSAYSYNTYVLGVVGGGLLFALTLFTYKLYSGTRMMRIIVGLVLMTFTIISIQQNLGRIEMHFHVFIALAFLTVYKDFIPATITALYIAVHHLLFTYLQLSGVSIFGTPIMIYNYGCGFDIAFLHAFYVIFEWIILVIIIYRANEEFNSIVKYKNELGRSNEKTQESIEYASLIQGALIPDKQLMSNYFSDYLTIWQPKDIVGGDIYLFEELREKDECLLMLIDCTGHGVPGAFITMLVKAIERQVVSKIENDKSIDVSPAWILSYFNKTMKKLLQQESKESISNAGLDGGIIYYNRKKQILKFAGAETPLFYIEDKELKTIKGNHHSIGYKKSDVNYEFEEHIINVKEGMRFYLTTDGYLDQNGGEKGFPFGKNRFTNIVQKNYNENFRDQEKILMNALKDYQGSEERNDDITIVGFEIKKSVLPETIVEYNGVLTQGIIAHTMEVIDNKISNINMMGKISTVIIELTQNMMHYGKIEDIDSDNKLLEGFFELTHTSQDIYHIKTKSIVSLKDKEKIESAINEIKSLDEATIKKRYKELRRSGENSHGKGAGIGFYEIAKLVKEMDCDFTKLNEERYLYEFTAQIVSKKIKKL